MRAQTLPLRRKGRLGSHKNTSCAQSILPVSLSARRRPLRAASVYPEPRPEAPRRLRNPLPCFPGAQALEGARGGGVGRLPGEGPDSGWLHGPRPADDPRADARPG